ncbi:hypothetical protein A9Q89_03070 [Gammaproteobacteria bacterium 53_120_T64]|nr:hypothetical protein A9Q89_03070 [Gammaproteobacteria bacterium 53_120_T64]
MGGESERRLSFCVLRALPNRVIEVTPDHGIEINLAMVEELDRSMIEMMGNVFAILVNKVNAYSVSFEAQVVIGTLKEATATAVLVYDRFGEMGTEQIKAMSEGEEKKIDIFFDKGQAIDWLETKMAALP